MESEKIENNESLDETLTRLIDFSKKIINMKSVGDREKAKAIISISIKELIETDLLKDKINRDDYLEKIEKAIIIA